MVSEIEHNDIGGLTNFSGTGIFNEVNIKRIDSFIDDDASEDYFLNSTQIIQKYGYDVEAHYVLSEDGYILKMFRIPGSGPVVLLMHGLLESSDDWITTGSNNGIALRLAAQNFDVWMGNARGNRHSLNHIYLNSHQPEFWNFTWHEIGIYDVPVLVDHVLEATNSKSLIYIGHSQGTTTFYVMASMKPQYNEKISLMISLSSVAYCTNIKSLPLRLLSDFVDEFYALLMKIGVYDLFGHDDSFQPLETVLCGNTFTAFLICKFIESSLVGFNYAQANIPRLPVIYRHFPTGISLKQFVHYLQLGRTEYFQQFDYGPLNLEQYGSEHPPSYPIENITAPIAIFFGEGDLLAVREDVEKFAQKLPNLIDFYTVPNKKFQHFDFLWSRDINKLVLAKLFDLVKIYA
ncbi:lipase 1-like [Leptidea sinapis]|uniref:lipase 1-like n=1 Tax=Leptidea sinapis TaxID=189913 RepID=UPI0021C34C7A|nr:lipase 1-like [Leptidea sinapis]